jgi:hypothetical protein
MRGAGVRRGLVALLFAAAVVSQANAEVVTPGKPTAVVIAPFNFDTGFHDDYKAALNALRGEGYTVPDDKVFAPDTLGGAGSPTIKDFVDSSGVGVLVISTHGACLSKCPYSGLSLQVFETQAAAEAAEGDLVAKGWTHDELKVGAQSVKIGGEQRRVFDLVVTAAGIEKHWKGSHTFVYLSACCSFALEPTFKEAGADVVFGYTGGAGIETGATDFNNFWKRLDGTLHGGNPSRQSKNAYDECCPPPLHRPGDPQITPSPSVVLAPSVSSVSYTPKDANLSEGAELDATITFDTPMDTSSKDTRSLVKVSGCGSSWPVGYPRWSANGLQLRGIQIHVEAQGDSTAARMLTITVFARKVTSVHGQVLDGNTNPKPTTPGNDAAVAPAGDDYVWSKSCNAACPQGQQKGPMIRAGAGATVGCSYGWVQMHPAKSPSPRSNAAMVFDAATGQTVLYGGYNGTSYDSDTWTWDGKNWTERCVACGPGPVQQPTNEQAPMGYDPVRHEVVMWVPYVYPYKYPNGVTGVGIVQQTWVWSGLGWKQACSSCFGSNQIGEGTIAFDQHRHELIMYANVQQYAAGQTGPAWKTYAWTGSSWQDVTPASGPSMGGAVAMATDWAGKQVLLETPTGFDVWNGSNWSALPATSPFASQGSAGYGPPVGLYANAMAYDPSSKGVLLEGGSTQGSSTATPTGTWIYASGKWSIPLGAGHSGNPGIREDESLADGSLAHPGTSPLLLFGGQGQGLLGDTWTYSGKPPATR